MTPIKPGQTSEVCSDAVPSAYLASNPSLVGKSPATRWLPYVVAAGAAAGATLAARGGVVYSGPQDLVLNPGWADGVDLDASGSPDLFAFNWFNSSGLVLYQRVQVLGPAGGLAAFNAGPSNFSYATAVAAGSEINGSSVGSNMAGWLAYGSQMPNAQFIGAANRYLGLAFSGETGLRYGWIRVSIDSTLGRFTIHDWAYEDTGAGIRAGVVPAPGALGLLAAGAAGLSLLRGRKRM